MIDDNMCDLIELFRRPFGKMIPGACLPIIDCLCRLKSREGDSQAGGLRLN